MRDASSLLAVTSRLEAAGLERRSAEAIATEIWLSTAKRRPPYVLNPATKRRIDRNATHLATWLIFLIVMETIILHALATK